MPLDDDTLATLAGKLDSLWKASKPAVLERLATLESSCAVWMDAPEDSAALHDALHSARDAAHKLAGILGTFGLARGSQIASELEAMVAQPSPAPAATVPLLIEELRSIIAAKE